MYGTTTWNAKQSGYRRCIGSNLGNLNYTSWKGFNVLHSYCKYLEFCSNGSAHIIVDHEFDVHTIIFWVQSILLFDTGNDRFLIDNISLSLCLKKHEKNTTQTEIAFKIEISLNLISEPMTVDLLFAAEIFQQ